MKRHYIGSFVTLAGVLGFVVIVTYLHFGQTNYDPLHQFMSELASRRHGFLMLWAFMSLAAAVAGATSILASHGVHPAIRLLLGMASLSLVGAGVLKLGDATTAHVALIALVFFLSVLSMYLIPRTAKAFQEPIATAVCWGSGAGMAFFFGLGQGAMPIGLAQRFTTACLLLWLCWLAIFNFRRKDGRDVQQ